MKPVEESSQWKNADMRITGSGEGTGPTPCASHGLATAVRWISRRCETSGGAVSECRPIEDDLAGLAGIHDLEAFQVLVDAIAMGDHGPYVEAALQHRRHLVPRLEHLAAVDALDDQALEDDLIPVDGGLLGRDAEHGDAAAVVHGAQHLAQRRGVARHLETHIEAFLHPEIAHRLIERFAPDVDRARGPHRLREPEAVVVDVGDDDVARADVPG